MTDVQEEASEPASGPRPLWLRLFGHDISAPLFLLVLSLLLFVPGQWTVPPLDRDEPRFTQATKQMLETGDFVDIRFQDQPRHKKPVGIYWLQVAAAKATGFGPEAPLWVYRIPSVAGAVLAVLLSYWAARAFVGPPTAFVTGLLVGCAIILEVEAHLAKTDAMLFATILAAQGALARIWLKRTSVPQWGLVALFWTALAAGVLIKGPVILMITGLTIAGLCILTRQFAWLKSLAPLVGFAWMLLLISPWFVLIGIATDWAFYKEAIGKDLLGKVGQGQEGHGAPPLTHLLAMLVVFWPLPAFLMMTVRKIWRERASDLVVFCGAWFVPSWVVFELVATKLPHYTMPLLPALALPVAAALVHGVDAPVGKARRWAAAVLLVLPVAGVAAAAFAGPIYLGVWPSPPGGLITVIGAVFAFVAAAKLVRSAPLEAWPPAVMAAIAVAIGFWGFVGPALSPIWVSPRLVETIETIESCPDPLVVTSGFHEPSFIFLQGTETRIVLPEEGARHLAEAAPGECRVAVIESRNAAAFFAEAGKIGLVPLEVGRVDGLNINGGKLMDIGLYVPEKAE